MSVYLDTNVIVRHLTGDPPGQARSATRFLAAADELVVTDVIVAETVYVLESFYEVPRAAVADLLRSVMAFGPIRVNDEGLLFRALEIYEVHRLDYAEASLVASAESGDTGTVISFDRAVSRMTTVTHVDPSRP